MASSSDAWAALTAQAANWHDKGAETAKAAQAIGVDPEDLSMIHLNHDGRRTLALAFGDWREPGAVWVTVAGAVEPPRRG